MSILIKGVILFSFALTITSTISLSSFAGVNATGIICGLDDGHDYGYSFNNGKVLKYSFIVTDDKVLSNIKPLGTYKEKSGYIEWNILSSNTPFWFRLNKNSFVLTTESEEAEIKFDQRCEVYELMEWNRRLSELGNNYQDEYDKYIQFKNEYNKSLKLN